MPRRVLSTVRRRRLGPVRLAAQGHVLGLNLVDVDQVAFLELSKGAAGAPTIQTCKSVGTFFRRLFWEWWQPFQRALLVHLLPPSVTKAGLPGLFFVVGSLGFHWFSKVCSCGSCARLLAFFATVRHRLHARRVATLSMYDDAKKEYKTFNHSMEVR